MGRISQKSTRRLLLTVGPQLDLSSQLVMMTHPVIDGSTITEHAKDLVLTKFVMDESIPQLV